MNGKSSRYDKLESMLQDGRCSEPHNLPLKYLRDITNNFSDERLLGEGGFGTVYKGVLQNGETIAVKKLHSSIPGVKGSHFENEANHLMRLKHPNVVLLVGWCFENENTYTEYNGKYIWAEKLERLLCLEYMPKGNLRAYLSDEFSGLGWDTRYKIIEGICYGLHYLHKEWQLNARIVHMDLKPANILLDNNMVPKIADFGLSRLFSEEKTWTCTISRDGTLGYMSPEYINKGLISTKSDIFSLGVIIIEIVTGHRDYPDETGTSSKKFIETVLNNWSQRNRVENLFGHVSLEVEYQQIRKCIQIGLDCVKIDRFKRPTISQIIETLHGLGSAYSSNIKGTAVAARCLSIHRAIDMEGGLSPERHAAVEPVRSRWTPKPEQILILESIFNSGMVNPPKDGLRKLLERFGAVSDANVFYWFQNRRSQLQAQAAAAAAAGSSSSSGSPPTSGGAGGLAPGHAAASSTMGMFAHGAGAGAYGSSTSTSWPPSPPPSSCAGMMGDLDYGGSDDLFAISRQMGYANGGGSGSASSAAVAHHEQQQQLYYSSCQPASMRVFINGLVMEVPRGPIDLRSVFGQDVMLVHSTGGLLPVNEYGVLTQSLQMGESYFLVTRG